MSSSSWLEGERERGDSAGRECGRRQGGRWSTALFDRHGFLKQPTKQKVTAMSDPIPQSDVSRPSALPTASLLQSRTSAAARLAQSQAQNSAQYLDDIEEEWNKKVDTEIETLVDGMVDIVSLASVSYINTLNPIVREVEHRERFEKRTSSGWHRRRSKLNAGQSRWCVNPFEN